ncbi:hypothetical protein BJF90_13540 [Pseudonocardia sp. CNS-004]|nr:hypothetical protein BJF90_13540 [Pseudonocardia sp. CNS-004]
MTGQLAQALVNGVLLGCVYAGFALGLTLVMGVLRIVNVAHSAVLVMAALVYWELVNSAGLDPLLSVVPVVVLFYVVGLGVHRGLVARLAREHDSTVLLATFGLMVVIESVAVLIWATDPRSVRLGYLDGVLRFWSLDLPLGRVVAAAGTLVLVLGLHLLLTRTLTGSAVRAIAQNPDVAGMVGIDVARLARTCSPRAPRSRPSEAPRSRWSRRSARRSTSGGSPGRSSW